MNIIENLKEGGFVGQVQPNSLIHADCLDAMKYIESKSIDMILCDLPYGTTSCKWDVIIPFNKYVQIGKKVIYEQEYVFDKMKSGVSYKQALEDFLSISKDGLWDNYKRIIKDRGAIVLFGSEPFASSIRNSNLNQYRYDWVWHKNKSGNVFQYKNSPMKRHEMILVFSKQGIAANCLCCYYPDTKNCNKKVKTVYKEGGDYIHGVIKTKAYFMQNTGYPESILKFDVDKHRLHPTQKPVALLEYLIKTYTLEGETVLDNCMGSGSTGVACINTNRNFIGIEKDDKYFEIAKKRIEETQNANT